MSANYSNVSMLDMVFEHRNKAYGAYVLRRDYNKSLQTAIASILSLITLLCLGNFIRENMRHNNKQENTNTGVVTTTDLHKKVEKEIVKPKPKPEAAKLKPQSVAAAANVEKKVVEDSKAPADTIIPNKDLADLESGLKTNLNAPVTGLGVTDGNGKDQVFEVAKQAEPSPTVYTFVENMPQFPGGDEALRRYMSRTVEYPQMERDNGIGGKVLAQFTVNEDGTVSDIQILRSPSNGFNREVIRVIKTLPLFKPGMQQGKAVKVRFVLPVMFNLN